MKFKKIEISAFRIYDDPADATFDFTLNDGSVADFISLYAPNGFGKTSLYDAIEWCITGNVQRFWQNEAVADKSISSQKEVTQQVKLWRHTNSENDTYVKIEVDKGKPKLRELKIDGRHTLDAKKDKLENGSFRKVILSQEWISAFLREVDGERRYKIFMENPDLKETDNYYKGLKELISYCNDRTSSLNSEADQKRAQIVEITEENLLESVNSTITLLQNQGEKIALVTLDMSKEDVLALRNLIADRIIANPTTSIAETLIHFNVARIGSETIPGIEKFYEIPDSIEKFEQELKEYGDLLEKFKSIELLETEKKSNATQRQEMHKNLDLVENLIKGFGNYTRISNSIDEKNKSKSALQQELGKMQNQLAENQRLEIAANTELDTLTSEVSLQEQLIRNIPDLKKVIEDSEKQLSFIQKEADQQRFVISDLQKKSNESGQRKERFEGFLRDVRKDILSSIPVPEFPEIGPLIEQQQSRLSGIEELQRRTSQLEKEIEKNEDLNSTISEFIQRGLEIVNRTESASCPLCTQTYSSYQELSQRISGNSALNDTLQHLLGQKSSLAADINGIQVAINTLRNQLADYFAGRTDAEAKVQNTHNENTGIAESKLRQASETLRTETERIDQARKQLEGENPDTRLQRLTDLLKKVREDVELKRNTIIEIKGRILNNIEWIKTARGTILLTETEVGNLDKDPAYKTFLDQYLLLFPSQQIDERVLIDRKGEISTAVLQLSERFNNIEAQLTILRQSVTSYNKVTLSDSIAGLTESIEKLQLSLNTFTNFLKDKLSIETDFLNKEDLLRLIAERETAARTQLEQQEKVKQNYERLDKFTENLQPYLLSAALKVRVKEIEADVKFHSDTVMPRLTTERDKTREFLDKRVRDFFYKDLINALYNKIDPHPNFRSVDFRVNFDSDNPKLDIYVMDSSSDQQLIPNLYFSTAQINILSLSIFLATALNSNEYNCIFIDDPIQSLDSINVLSTIDLIRSIVMNQKRQVVLSTHDENFHRLLERKMPSTLFKSKFIELETFGKVKGAAPILPSVDENLEQKPE